MFDPRCIPCIVNQATRASALFAEGNKERQLAIIKEVCREIEEIDSAYTAPLFSARIQSIVERHTGMVNPYGAIKEQNRRRVEAYLPYIKGLMDRAEDRLEVAVRAAIVGNIIDLGASPTFDIESEVNRLESDFIDLSMLPRFKQELAEARVVLYIGDNYEEALFDKFLLSELLPRKVVFAVRSRPILNDITLDDARRIGIDVICRVIESGSTIAGTDMKTCSPEFLKLYHEADIVIAKGQGNYETLIDETRAITFIFRIKCEVIAERSGIPVGSGVLLVNPPSAAARP